MSFFSGVGAIARYVYLIPVRLYRLCISPFIGPCCRFTPSCSEYAIQAVEHYGIILGTLKAALRILRCNPFGGSGFDPAVSEEHSQR